MYSAGKEQVVVKWSLETSSKEETKEFLPRLSGQIKHLSLSHDNSLIAVSLDDNSNHLKIQYVCKNIQSGSNRRHICCIK